MKAIITVLIVLLVVLQYRLWFGQGSMTEVHHLESALQAQQEENDALEERNRSLAAETQDLKQGDEAIEERARSEMGMIKEGETFYRIIESPTRTATN